MRTAPFSTDGYYHVYNRGVDKRIVFHRFGHYLHFVSAIRNILNTGSATQRRLYNQSLALKSKVGLLAYCLMPNHYHLLLKQLQNGGITEFMQKLDTSYTKYFNLNNHRSGHLFEYSFKAKHIESDELLLHVSRYIHLNPVIASLVEQPEQWRWSSIHDYLDIETKPLCQTGEILSFFSSPYTYKQFLTDQISYARLLKEIEDEKNEDAIFL